MGRFVFYNPHSIWLCPTFASRLGGGVAVPKYKNFFSYYYSTNKIIYVCIDDSLTVVCGAPERELYKWIFINGMNPLKFKILRMSELCKSDVIFGFQFLTFNNISSQDEKFWESRKAVAQRFFECKALKVFNLTHYFVNPVLASKLTLEAGVDLLVSENNLAKNSAFFRKFYPWYEKNVYQMPFIPGSRFKSFSKFSERKNLVAATGTIAPATQDVELFFDEKTLQPMREEIYKNSIFFKDKIQSFIEMPIDFRTYVAPQFSRFGRIYRLLKYFMRAFAARKFEHTKHPWSSYDIVKTFNTFKMAIVPEEIVGLPGISFAEAMSCGTAYIGISSPMYSDMGMIENKHFIAYDGSLKNLLDIIEYYQGHGAELEIIASEGENFAKKYFSADVVCTNFINFCLKMARNRATG